MTLAQAVMTPPLLVDVIRHRVESLDIDSTLSDFMLMVKTKDYSQAPVLQGGRYVDMLTLGRLARWIAEKRHFDWFDLDNTPVGSVLGIPLQAEEHFARCEPDIDIAQALNLFDFGGGESDGARSIPVRGLIVLEAGAPGDSLRALVTYEDLPRMLRALGRGA